VSAGGGNRTPDIRFGKPAFLAAELRPRFEPSTGIGPVVACLPCRCSAIELRGRRADYRIRTRFRAAYNAAALPSAKPAIFRCPSRLGYEDSPGVPGISYEDRSLCTLHAAFSLRPNLDSNQKLVRAATLAFSRRPMRDTGFTVPITGGVPDPDFGQRLRRTRFEQREVGLQCGFEAATPGLMDRRSTLS
jgi:hypothetical protein